ncbi:MAG TPA: hypothetical protein VLH08_22085 [Acidobacteriota bacterium]|nr:hypothetical protein [Acidobacteriota bacterium]
MPVLVGVQKIRIVNDLQQNRFHSQEFGNQYFVPAKKMNPS